MPELPEVETVRRSLELYVEGAEVRDVRGQAVMMRRPLDPEALARHLVGRRFTAPRRRGKFLLLDTEPAGALLVHLGMSGRLQLAEPSRPAEPHTHLWIGLDGGRELRLLDPRRFGLAVWLEPGDEVRDPSLARLGPEPLDPSLPDVLPELVRHSRAPVKAILLDQRVLAGVGNIYATEALWRAGIRPTRPGCRIAAARIERLAVNVQEVLREAIAVGGTTLRDFASPDGSDGYFRISLAAYGREGEPCLACGATLRRAVVGGRSTAWCAGCQT